MPGCNIPVPIIGSGCLFVDHLLVNPSCPMVPWLCAESSPCSSKGQNRPRPARVVPLTHQPLSKELQSPEIIALSYWGPFACWL